jgi:N utilization substance protein A
MTTSQFMSAIEQICDEKGLSKDVVLETVEAALAAAYRKDYGSPRQIIRAKLSEVTGEADMFRVYQVVESEEEIEEKEAQLLLKDAKKLDKKAEVGSEVVIPLPRQADFGRIAAQTAKQVIIQRIREAERDMLFKEYKDKEQTIINGSVQQLDGGNVIVNIGKANAVMYPSDQVKSENYYIGQRIKVFLKEVVETARGPQILVSRSDAGLIKGLFELEVPEIPAGAVEIKNIVREAGYRTKIAVAATQDGVDPIGSCVGQRGTRVQAILAEIGDEKIDIVLWDEDVENFIINALSPAKCEKIVISSKDNKATVYVPEDSLSLAIGKGGQNVRLASKLTGWGIDIEKIDSEDSEGNDAKMDGGDQPESEEVVEESDDSTEPVAKTKKTKVSKSKTK